MGVYSLKSTATHSPSQMLRVMLLLASVAAAVGVASAASAVALVALCMAAAAHSPPPLCVNVRECVLYTHELEEVAWRAERRGAQAWMSGL